MQSSAGQSGDRSSACPGPYDAGLYDFDLPPELIAQEPLAERDLSRLLIVDRGARTFTDATFRDLLRHVGAGDVLVFNDTRVLRSRVELRRADTGGHVEVLVLSVVDDAVEALVQTRGRLTPGVRLFCDATGPHPDLVVMGEPLQGGIRTLSTGWPAADLFAWLARVGRTPLPPYIRRKRGSDPHDAEDASRYQTVYAKHEGAVAAPTAGLHFTERMLADLDRAGVLRASVTLHVGAGTFRPVTADDVRSHLMHSERYSVPAETAEAVRAAKAAGRRVVAVGTTSVRALESATGRDGVTRAQSGTTSLFIHPPAEFRAVDALLTNFHVPRSTLIMLVCAFAGRELTLAAYRHAVERRYRMLSYGDATLFI